MENIMINQIHNIEVAHRYTLSNLDVDLVYVTWTGGGGYWGVRVSDTLPRHANTPGLRHEDFESEYGTAAAAAAAGFTWIAENA